MVSGGAISLIGLLLSACSAILAFNSGKNPATRTSSDGMPGRGVNRHVLSYFCWTVAVTCFVAVLLINAGWLYGVIGGVDFLVGSDGNGIFDAGAYVGLLAVLLGVPLAISGSFYAIYLAQASLAVSNRQVELSAKQIILEHPAHGSLVELAALRSKMRLLITLCDMAVEGKGASDAREISKQVLGHASSLVSKMEGDDISVALLIAGDLLDAGDGITQYHAKVASLKGLLADAGGSSRSASEIPCAIIKSKLEGISDQIPRHQDLVEAIRREVADG